MAQTGAIATRLDIHTRRDKVEIILSAFFHRLPHALGVFSTIDYNAVPPLMHRYPDEM
jgi:hypothetical protein